MNTAGSVNNQPAPGCMEKSSCKWPVIIGIIVGGVVSLIAVVCAIRCCCRRRRRRRRRSIRSITHIDSPHLHISAQGYQPNMKPPAYDSSKIVVDEDFPQKPKMKKDDALPPIPTEDVPRHKKVLDQEYEQGLELDKLKAAPTPIQPVSANQAAQPEDGLIPLKTPHFRNPFEAPAPAPASATAPADNKNPFDASSLGENRDYNPVSPVSPQRSYSPFSPSNYTRYTTSPFNDPPSRQSTPFSSAASMRTVSYIPPPSPYMAYSSSTAIPQSPSLLDEPKSPYRAYSPLLTPRYEFSAPTPPPPTVVDPPSETTPRNISSLNHEPLEMSTSYNTRPQSMAQEEQSYRGLPNQARGELPNEEKASIVHELSETKPANSTPTVTSERPQEHHLDLPQELPTRNSAYGETNLPMSKPASTDPPEPVQLPADVPRQPPPAGPRSKNPFRSPRPE